MAVIGPDKPGVEVGFLDQVRNLDALHKDLRVGCLYSQHYLLRQLQNGLVDSLILQIGHLLLIELLVFSAQLRVQIHYEMRQAGHVVRLDLRGLIIFGFQVDCVVVKKR